MAASRKRCCTPCVDNTGCGGSNTLCTGKSFLLPNIDAVSVSGGESINEADDPYVSGHPYQYYVDGDGTIAGNTGLHGHWNSLYLPPVSANYSVSTSTVSQSAFKMPTFGSSVRGFKFTANIGGTSYTFDGTAGAGASLSAALTAQALAKGTWAVGPETDTDAYGYTETEIEDYDFEQTIETFASYETQYFFVSRDYNGTTKKFSYSLWYYVSRTEWMRVTDVQSRTLKIRYVRDTGPSPLFDYTQRNETSAAGWYIKKRTVSATGSVSGQSASVSGSCAGDDVTFSAVDSDSNPADGSPQFVTGTGEAVSPTHGGEDWPPVFTSPYSSNEDWVTGTGPTGSVTMSLDTGTWTESEVGCRDCPRYLTFSGSISHAAGTDDSVNISGRIVQSAVPACAWYQCEWATNGTTATATIELPDGDVDGVATLSRYGPSLWLFTIQGTGGAVGFVYKFFLKFGGECPTGSPTICQAPLGWTTFADGVQSGSSSEQANHFYGDYLVYDSGTNTYSNAPYDYWTIGDHTITATDLAAFTVGPNGYSDLFSNNSLTFTEVDRETGDPDYFCEGFKAWNTGEESDEFGSDLHWTVENANESGVFVPAVVQTDNSFLVYYATPVADAAWIGIDEHGSYYGGIRRYRTTITVEGTLADDITGNVSSDNQTLAIYINGTLRVTTPTPTGVDSHELKHDFTLDKSWFTTGINTVDFEVNDDVDSEPHANGLLVEWDD